MRVPLEPSANLAARNAPNVVVQPRATSAPSSADEAVPVKHKPILQARRNQYEDYRNLKDRDFQSLHEEVSHLRQCTRDQERIIGILKEEKNRLLAELLQKGKDLQHVKDLMKRPTQSTEERNLVDDLRRTLADRECSIDELKSEIVRLNNVHQRVLEEHDDVASQLKQMEQQVFNAEQEAAHRSADAERLKKDIELLNEEMTARVNSIHTVVNEAAAVGKRDASTDHHLLEEQLDAWKQKYEGAQALLKRAQDEEQRQKELALRQQAAANEVAAEKTQLLAEVRRQQSLLAEIEELKSQIEAFRVDKATTEELLREKLHVALVDIHEEKEVSRRLMAEVDEKEDLIAAREREIAKLQRDFDAKLEEACAGNKQRHQETEGELVQALHAAQKEKVLHAEEAARVSMKCEMLQRRLHDMDADLTTALVERDALRASAAAAANGEVPRMQELEAALLQAQAALEETLAEVDALRAQLDAATASRLGEGPESSSKQQWDDERLAMESRHRAEIDALSFAHEAALEEVAQEAARHNEALSVEVAALREAQSEHDQIRHETLASEAARLTHALNVATTQLEEERAEKALLEVQIEELSEAVNGFADTQEQSQNHAAQLASQVASQAEELRIAAEALEAAEKRMQGLQDAALQQAEDAGSTTDKRLERLEKEKKQLRDKLKAAEVALDDKQKSLDIRAQQLRHESESAKQAQDALKLLRAEVAREKDAHDSRLAAAQEALQRTASAHEGELAQLHAQLAAAKQSAVLLAEENDRMKNIQMHW